MILIILKTYWPVFTTISTNPIPHWWPNYNTIGLLASLTPGTTFQSLELKNDQSWPFRNKTYDWDFQICPLELTPSHPCFYSITLWLALQQPNTSTGCLKNIQVVCSVSLYCWNKICFQIETHFAVLSRVLKPC